MPPALDDTEQLDCCKPLGVIFQSNFKMDSHIQFVLSQCAQKMYVLKLLRHRGLPDAQLSVIAVAVGPPRPSNFCYFRLFHYFCVDFIYFLPPKLIIV